MNQESPSQLKKKIQELENENARLKENEEKYRRLLEKAPINGMEVIKSIRQTNTSVKITAQTAHAMGEGRELFLQAGADDYITKHIEINDLLNIINKYS